ncbi:hypothetical protein NG800_005520 [Epilithonimonas ginsengisoli]|uniref:Uncharacterized protein n=1 Tax=Epilithonimonas ginsengisoli TaxID=1245592 RepID=A0ABU4JFL4_9FLAO|nr:MULTISPECIES: hypothetical protein [Chryseobacterium group]MBV6879719.1 hypothetical protein [Epilithonimonas sp. FP105]MDW8548358.1 hypothetical protein [Epilithonimonas ginsengisoli]OAH72589.1 hypothetical protein AXA65_10225 [Chryseobacterium sp. FP211-J200]
MIKKIKRDICIIKYRSLPLTEYEKETDSDVYNHPNIKSAYWLKLEKDSPKNLRNQFIKLIKNLEIENLIILGEMNKPWISKFTSKRKDYKPLIKSLEYFKSQKITTIFNGGLELHIDDLVTFFPHFYTITRCDGGFFDYNMIDEKQNIILYLHYSGEIKIMILNKKFEKKFLKEIKKTDFIDSMRDNADRL